MARSCEAAKPCLHWRSNGIYGASSAAAVRHCCLVNTWPSEYCNLHLLNIYFIHHCNTLFLCYIRWKCLFASLLCSWFVCNVFIFISETFSCDDRNTIIKAIVYFLGMVSHIVRSATRTSMVLPVLVVVVSSQEKSCRYFSSFYVCQETIVIYCSVLLLIYGLAWSKLLFSVFPTQFIYFQALFILPQGHRCCIKNYLYYYCCWIIFLVSNTCKKARISFILGITYLSCSICANSIMC